MISIKRFIFIIIIATACIFYAGAASAIQIPEKRVILTPDAPTKSFKITNDADATQTYFVDWSYYTMENSGRLIKHTDTSTAPDINWADQIVSLNTTKVTLKSGESHAIDISLKDGAPDIDFEHRAHLWIYTEPPSDLADKKKNGFNISFLTGIAIPVLVRSPALKNVSKITDISITPVDGAQSKLNFKITNEGTQSSFGNITLSCVSDGELTQTLKTMNGFAVYPEAEYRQFSVPLNARDLSTDTCPTISILFGEKDAFFATGTLINTKKKK